MGDTNTNTNLNPTGGSTNNDANPGGNGLTSGSTIPPPAGPPPPIAHPGTVTVSATMVKIDALAEEDFLKKLDVLVEESYKAFEYQGFDPIKMKAAFKEKYSGKEWCKVLYLVAGTLCIRGSNLSKILKKATDDLKTEWGRYRTDFVQKRNGKYGSDDFTLPRIAACFPIEVAKVANKVNHCIVAELSTLPKLITSNVFAPVCPTSLDSEDEKMLAKFNNIYLIRFDEIIRPKNRSHHTTIANYFNIARQNKMVKDDDRRKLIQDLKLVEQCKLALLNPVIKGIYDNTFVSPLDDYDFIAQSFRARMQDRE